MNIYIYHIYIYLHKYKQRFVYRSFRKQWTYMAADDKSCIVRNYEETNRQHIIYIYIYIYMYISCSLLLRFWGICMVREGFATNLEA